MISFFLGLGVTSTLSDVVFERLPANDEVPSESKAPTCDTKREDQPAPGVTSVVGQASASKDGEKNVRKQWGEGEGVPVVELLQHKQLQTATYAIGNGDTG